MSDLLEFLRRRGLKEDDIKRLEEDKIDLHVLPLMDDAFLERYIPLYGDRLATVAFCKTKEKQDENGVHATDHIVPNNRISLMDRLKGKSARRKRRSGVFEDTSIGNKNACKASKRVEIGWMHYDGKTSSYRQVRMQNGGGTRHTVLEKDMGTQQILSVGKCLFFPEENSKKGNIEDFEFCVKDFALNDIGDMSVGDLYDKTMVPMLRLYICTKTIERAEDDSKCSATTISRHVIADKDTWEPIPHLDTPSTVTTNDETVGTSPITVNGVTVDLRSQAESSTQRRTSGVLTKSNATAKTEAPSVEKLTELSDFTGDLLDEMEVEQVSVSSPVTVVSSPVAVVPSPVTVTVVSSPATVVSSTAAVVSSPVTVVSSPATVVYSPATVVSSPVAVVPIPVTVVSSPAAVVSSPVTVVSSPVTITSSPARVVSGMHHQEGSSCQEILSDTPTIVFNYQAARRRTRLRRNIRERGSPPKEEYTEHGLPDLREGTQSGETYFIEESYEISQEQELFQGFRSLNSSLEGEETIQVYRRNLSECVFDIYTDPNLPGKNLKVQFLGETGDDFGGLAKDFFTNAWKVLLTLYFDGEDVVVPSLPLYRMRVEKDRFLIIGRFISHYVAVMSQLPPRLSRCSLLGIVFEDDAVSDETLLKDFLLYLTPPDRSLLGMALHQFNTLDRKQKDALMDFFSIHGMQQLPSDDKIRQQILGMAQSILVDKPAPYLRKVRQGIPNGHIEKFWSLLTTDGIDSLFKHQRPTAKRLVELVEATDEVLRPNEERSLHYFKQYILTLDQDDLADLLLFITGSTSMPDKLKVSFINVTGEARCPVVHTCSNLIELPSTYWSVHDLKREFRAILSCPHSFEMSIM